MKPEKFKDALTQLGMSQAEFARRTGVDATTVSRWMQGHSPLPTWAVEYIRVLLLAKEMLG
jgi:transcriptional regulator with XRE-family HTH domain